MTHHTMHTSHGHEIRLPMSDTYFAKADRTPMVQWTTLEQFPMPSAATVSDYLVDAERVGCLDRRCKLGPVVDACAFTWRVPASDIYGHGRNRILTEARSTVVCLARMRTCLSYPELARALNRDNHSTIITMQRRLEPRTEPELIRRVAYADEVVRTMIWIDVAGVGGDAVWGGAVHAQREDN